ncbi:DEAD/DEAH box helicase family protein, partial [Thiolapillus sp.]|uniref:DEAD/DEAH box helicase family protein n=1 Tax=Thiolapillus sp. TaxID=2017437 RepID=UPI003AF7495F
QTRQEFNRFQPGCVEENTNTETLVQRLLSDDYTDKVIVTTIQKLGLALDANHRQSYRQRLEPLRDKRMVFIFDECHRFGKQLHAYTITHAIDDGNVLRFHVDYFKGGGAPIKPGEALAKQAEDGDGLQLNVACIFSPPAEGNRDVAQLQEDLPHKRVFGLVIDFGTSQSPKSTRPLTTYLCPSRPGHQALRNN